MTKVSFQANTKVIGKDGKEIKQEDNKFSIASCPIMKRYPPLENCEAVITKFNFQGRHYIIYVKRNVQSADPVL